MAAFQDSRLPDRFWAKSIPEPNGGCWLWLGTESATYGQFWRAGRMHGAHRVAYEALVGPVPDPLELDHKCRVRCCVNPAHLEPVTHLVNVRRGIHRNTAKTRCPAGHPYDRENTYVVLWHGRRGRQCRTCNQARNDARAKVA